MKYKVTLIFLLINLVVHWIMQMLPYSTFLDVHDSFCFNTNNNPLTSITYSFFHKDDTHLYSNILAMVFFGVILEKILDAKNMIFLYIIGAIGGAIFFAIFCDQKSLLIGASAACFAFMSASLVLDFGALFFILFIFFFHKDFWALVENPFYSVPTSVGHLGGLIFGAIYAFTIKIYNHD